MRTLRVQPRKMIPARKSRGSRSGESGYAFIMALFLVVVIIIGSQVEMRNLLTEGRRQREEEMVWRGNQWVRAIRLYYHKKGAYPQTVDDLKTGLPQLHFLRSAVYKDPMNKPDGSWRFIYTNAAGQIIGSTRYATLQQMALLDMNGGQLPAPQLGALNGVPVSSMASNSTSTTGSNGGNSTTGDNNNGSNSGNAANPTSNQSAPPGATPGPAGAANTPGQVQNPLAQLKPTGPVDGPVIGGLLTGVGGGSKSDQASIRIYHGGKKYKEWEFIWNPLEDQAQALQQGLSALGQPTGQPAGAAGVGTNPFANPPAPGGAAGAPQGSSPQPQQ